MKKIHAKVHGSFCISGDFQGRFIVVIPFELLGV